MLARVNLDNGQSVTISKDDLIELLIFLKERNGKNDEHWEGEKLDYDKEIGVVENAIKNYDNGEYKYYYWAWW